MKLSKNRLNKIKAKKNASRKKFHLRKKGSKYNKSQKKHKRNTHLKQKTLKIYIGGSETRSNTSLGNESFTNMITENNIKISSR